MKNVFKAVLIICLFCSINVYADGTDGVETHDGVYLRFLMGGGKFSSTEKDLPAGDIELSGNAYNFGFNLGYAVVDNLILFGHWGFYFSSSPEMEQGGVENNLVTSFEVDKYGIGFTYYFMPVNIYISASYDRPTAVLTVDDVSGESQTGNGFTASVGKEWWVSDNWGLGLAFIFEYSKMKDKEPYDDKYVKAKYYGLAFTATYN